MSQNPLFAVCLFSILNIENGQPTELNNLGLFLRLSLAGAEKTGCQEGGSRPEAAQAHPESRGDGPIYQQLRRGGQLQGYPLALSPLSAVQPDILMIRLGFQRLHVLAISLITVSAGGSTARAGSHGSRARPEDSGSP